MAPGGSRILAPAVPWLPTLEAASRMARICALALSVDELLPEALREAAALCGAERAFLAAFPEGAAAGAPSEVLAFPAGDGDGALLASPPRRWEGVLPALRRGEAIVLDDGSSLSPDDPWRLLLAGTEGVSALLHPLRIGAVLKGALLFRSCEAGRFGDESLPPLSMAAPVFASALDRRSMERRLAASEARYRFLAESSSDFITLHEGADGECLYASPVSGRLLGVSPDAYRRSPRYAFVAEEDVDAVRAAERKLVADGGGSATVPHRLRRSDGATVEAETVLSILPGDGGGHRVLGVTRDVTARREVERSLFEERRIESLGHLAGGVAHEFNNLLAGIQGSAEILALSLPGGDGGEGMRRVETIGRLARRAAAITGQLLAYARRGSFDPEPVPLNRLVQEILPLLERSLPGNPAVKAELSPSLPGIRGDRTLLRRLLTGLCVNAAEAVPPGGTVTVRTRRGGSEGREERPSGRPSNRRGAPPPGERVLLEVEDGGCGMDGDTLARIFEPFFTTKFAGRGLGLPAACGIAESHGGSIEVSSSPGEGTTVSVSFPAGGGGAEEPEGAVPGGGAAPPSAPATTGPLPRRVLLAEDEEEVRTVLAELVASLGYEAVEARDGREALEIFSARPDDFGAVLLDQVMPRLTGDRAFAAMRRLRPGQKGILSSGYDESGRPGRYAEEGFCAFLHKPYRRGDLARALEQILGPPAAAGGEPGRGADRDGSKETT